MIVRDCFVAVVVTALALATSGWANASNQVVVVIGRGAPDLEQVAAQELAAQFKKLFDVDVVLTEQLPDKHEHLVLVGGPANNEATRELAGDSWPQLTEQGFILRSFARGDRRGLIVAGESSVATWWAVCELGHRFGIRYLLREDIYPDKQPLALRDLDILMEPKLKLRSWKTLGDGVTGPESWSAADQKKLLRQLAKMKFNQVILSMRPWQPYVNYQFRGVSNKSAALWRGEQYPIARDAPGRTAFGSIDSFVNPDFASQRTHDEMTAAGREHVRGIISAAQRLGMSVGLELAPLEFSHEFARAIPALVAVPGTNDLAVHPGPELQPEDAALRELMATQMRAAVATYAEIDALYFTLPEAAQWKAAVISVWRQLSKQLGPDAPKLAEPPALAFEGNQGVLSQSLTRRLNAAIDAAGRDHQPGEVADGFSVRYALLGELDPTMHYLSRAAWDKEVTARSAHDDLFTTITGGQILADRLWLGFGHIESATGLTARNGGDIAVPSATMMLKHYRSEPAPEWWEKLTEHYTQAMVELYRARGPADPRAQPLLYYYAKRSEYVLEYLGCVKAVRAAAIAKQNGDIDGAAEQLEAAIESLYNAIDTLGDVAQDPSDRGLIAALNAYAYRPLLTEYDRLTKGE